MAKKYIFHFENIHPRYKHLVAVDRWCEENCSYEWTNKIVTENFISYGTYIFDNEIDAMAFKLRWL